MMQDRILQSLGCGKTFFELMRRIEALFAEQKNRHEMQNRLPKGVRLMQPAALQFSSSEISKVSIELVGQDSQKSIEILIEQRNFGLFAPYGPLPIHITEHACFEKKFERNEAFEQFINMFSSNMAWLHYRAWSAMHPALCFDRLNQAFVSRLNGLVQISPEFAANHHPSVNACRTANLGVYFNSQRPLAALQRVLSEHFQVNVSVLPRRGRWFPMQHRAHVPVRIGRWRLGQRIWDVQQTIDIEIGPVAAKDIQGWQRSSKRILAIDAVVRDYTQARVDFAIQVKVKTGPELQFRLGTARTGVNTWLKPGLGLKSVTVHESF
jgi:type VI secretion system protein ImpH